MKMKSVSLSLSEMLMNFSKWPVYVKLISHSLLYKVVNFLGDIRWDWRTYFNWKRFRNVGKKRVLQVFCRKWSIDAGEKVLLEQDKLCNKLQILDDELGLRSPDCCCKKLLVLRNSDSQACVSSQVVEMWFVVLLCAEYWKYGAKTRSVAISCVRLANSGWLSD